MARSIMQLGSSVITTLALARWKKAMTPKMVVVATTLMALATTDALAQAVGTQFREPNLSGVYKCVQRCEGGRIGRIQARGWDLALMNEAGRVARAWIDRPGHIWVPVLNEGAVYSPDGFTIQFASGSVWVLVYPDPVPGSVHFYRW